jgi:ADP-ribosylglycohydrolase
MSEFENRREGLIFGAFVAEAVSLGVHWIYDPAEILKKYGRVTDYQAPGASSYHPRKQAGDQGHVGDQALVLGDFLVRERKWDRGGFMTDWLAIWPTYDDYVDRATKTVLGNVENGADPTNAASDSDELAGPARSVPLITFLAGATEDEVVQACIEHSNLTHASAEAEEATTFLGKAGYRLIRGAPLADVIRETAPAWAIEAADKVQSLPAVDAIGRLGQSCSISAALPAVIYLALRYSNNCEEAFIENAMVGGDSCARGLALGSLLGTAVGVDAIPQRWRDGLTAKARLKALLESSTRQ